MASSLYKKVSDEVIDYKCSTCYKKKKERKSEKFCVECHKHFCTKCLEAHNTVLDDHTLQEPPQAAGQVLLPTERCDIHPTKHVDSYCKDHDEVGCNTCAFENHRMCKTVLYIPNEVGQLFKTTELQQTRAGLDSAYDKVKKRERLRDRQMKVLKTEKEKQVLAVDSYVETLVAIIRNLGKAEKEKLVEKFKEEEDKFEKNTDKCEEVITDIQKCRSQLDNHHENTAQLFVNIKQGQKIMRVADQLVQEVQKIAKYQSPQFKPDKQIGQFLSSLQSLGSIDKKPLEVIEKENINPPSVVTSTQPPALYKTGQRQDINIKIKGDRYRCFILGSCLLPDGSLLLSDSNNKKLKRLDTTSYKVKDHCNLPAPSYGVCCISQQEAAVCLHNNTIQFISIGPHKMSLTRSIKLNHICYGISCWDNELRVSNAKDDVLFYTLTGSLIKSRNLGLSRTQHITLSQSGDVLYIADYDLGLIGVDTSGQEIFRYKGLGLNGCRSVCVDNCGSVFIGGVFSGNVVKVTEKGQPLGEVVPSSAGVCKLNSLSFDCSNRRLHMAGLSDTMIVIEMK